MSYCLECNKQLECNNKTNRQKKYCSLRCQSDHRYHQYITRWLKGDEQGSRGIGQVSNHIRKWLLEQKGEQCWECGWDTKNPIDNKCPLEIDHIDGIADNNTSKNLRILCPNCHALTPTYKNRNKGNGRHSRRQRYQEDKSY